MGSPQDRIVVVDANVIINLIHVKRLDLLRNLPGHKFVVPDHVMEEIRMEYQKEALRDALSAGYISLVSITDPEEIGFYDRNTRIMGKGESACLAIAQRRKWIIASDEKGRFRREAVKRLGEGKILTTPGILIMAIKAGILSVEEADGAKVILESRRFKMMFGSFGDLLG